MRIGTMLLWVAGLHVGVACILYATPWLQILAEGVFATVPDVGDRAVALWFTVTGLTVALLGACLRDVERRGGALPAPLVPGLVLLTIAIVVPMPNSGGWLFALIAAVAHRRRNAAPVHAAEARRTSA